MRVACFAARELGLQDEGVGRCHDVAGVEPEHHFGDPFVAAAEHHLTPIAAMRVGFMCARMSVWTNARRSRELAVQRATASATARAERNPLRSGAGGVAGRFGFTITA